MREKLIQIFLQKNSELNLSAIRDSDGVMKKHILDSIELNNFFELKKGSTICDIGTGGGFPLLPLAMSNPNCNFIGIDARRKKVDAVNDMIDSIKIKNAKCIWTRIENYGEKFDYITARAVGYIDKIIPRSYNLLKKGGYYIIYKQENTEELEALKKICKQYKLEVANIHKYSIFEGDIQRVIYILKKI